MNNQSYMLCFWHVIAGFCFLFAQQFVTFLGSTLGGVSIGLRAAGTTLGYKSGGWPCLLPTLVSGACPPGLKLYNINIVIALFVQGFLK